jgi:hypothetical protein
MRRALIPAIIALMAACRQTTEPPVQLVVALEANRTVVVPGDTVTFTVNATGNNLFGVVMDYGDSLSDQYATGGALTARVSFKHAYTAAGSFTVRAIVTDALVGEKEASIAIVVN